MDFLYFLGQMLVIFIFIAGIVTAFYLVFKIRQTSKVIEQVTAKDYTLLRILVPKQNEKTPEAAAEMFASIHGIFRPDQVTQDHLSFELAARDQYIQFFCHVPKELKDYVEGQIYAQYPTVEISEVQDYTDVDLSQWSVAAAELILEKPDFYPIKNFNNFQVDPLAGITSVLSKVGEGEQIWLQILNRPIADTWQEKTLEYVKMIESGAKPKDDSVSIGKILKGTVGFASDLGKMVVTGQLPEKKEEKKEKPQLAGPVVEALRAAEGKTTKLGFEVMIRVCAIARDEAMAVSKINGVLGAFKQYSVANMNGFTLSKVSTDKERILPVFQSRAFPTNGYILNVDELASIFHLPSQSVETPSIVWAGAKKGEPPANLPVEGIVAPQDVTLFGRTNYRHFNHRFGIKTDDRRYHMYAIGKTGTGKSTMLRNMIIDDIQKGRGVCVVDPHGDLINHVLDYIPADRVDDIVYFNPSDREHPVGFNLLEAVDPELKNIVASGLMSIFTKLWANVWSARMEYILRNTVLALLEYPNATLLEIMKMLVDPAFRRKVLYHVKDPVIRAFFLDEYEKWEPKFRTEAIAALQNKIGQFMSSSTIRNIMGQVHSTIDIREIMDTGKIMLVDLSVGKIGEDNAALLGSMIITKIQLAAMGRADTPEDDRKDFYLYVDEFQNFATESFAVILSEARKYHLNLIITHQYIAQMPEVVASAVFGNVGTIVAFRVGAGDASFLQKEFEPVFDANDLVNLDNYNIYLKMAIDARTATPFSSTTLPPFSGKNDNRDAAISESVRKYTVRRDDIEAEINARNEANSGKVGTLVEVAGEIIYQEELKPYEPMNPLPKNDVVGGVDLWKVRDKEGKPFYVEAKDYDTYMEAKGKDSDRPGAPKSAATEQNDASPDEQPPQPPTPPVPPASPAPAANTAATSPEGRGVAPVIKSISTPPLPESLPTPPTSPVVVPSIPVAPSDAKTPDVNNQPRRDREKDGGKPREKRPGRQSEETPRPKLPVQEASAPIAPSTPKHVHTQPSAAPAHSSRHDIVRHKIEEKFNQRDEKPSAPVAHAPYVSSKPAEPMTTHSGELTTVAETASDLPAAFKPAQSNLPATIAAPKPSAAPAPLTPPTKSINSSDSLHAKYNDLEADEDQDVIPLQEL